MENFIKEVEVDGISHSITLGDNMVGPGLKKDENGIVSLDINEEKLVKITYSELKSLRDNSQLVPGTFYRITDYVTTTTQSETKSANHPFDVIVLALSENVLCEDAKAILHEGDTYFADSDLNAWKLKYCLDNDKTRFGWADETNGKGVIYQMIDENRNNCPYDFKNILFHNTKFTDYTTSDKYYYTFSYVVSNVLYDGTTEKRVKNCYGNVMGKYHISRVLRLNMNVFKNFGFGFNCCNNTFGYECCNNTFGNNCAYNNFGNHFNSNTFWENHEFNQFGNRCYSNTFENDCRYNTFGNDCCYNTLKTGCTYNVFGNSCESNTFMYNCGYNTFGDNLNNYSLYYNQTQTSIILNEEFYDDGSGHLVPIKHPNLSTQPSILPYKFMGEYVYEQLIPVNKGDRIVNNDFALETPMIISAEMFNINSFKNINIFATKSNALLLDTSSELDGYINVKYTDGSVLLSSDGGGYYYGSTPTSSFNNSSIDFDVMEDGTLYIYDNDTLTLSKNGELTLTSIPSQYKNSSKIIIDDSVTSISYEAFSGCSSLTSISIPNSVTSIGDYAFQNCRSLPSVIIPNSVTSVGYAAFSGCLSLTSVTIPDGVTSIEMKAFANCQSLTSIEIPNSVTNILMDAFSSCVNLTSIVVASGNPIYDSREGCNAIVKTSSNELIVGCKSTIIPNSVTSIGDYAFYYCSSLTSVVIPNSVTSIGNSALAGCSGLTSIEIPNNVTSIGYYAFHNCTSLTSVTIPDGVTSIDIASFQGCTSLTSVTIPESVTSIGYNAFYNCSSLTSVTIPESVTSIGLGAFHNCTSLTSVTIPDGVTSIEMEAFKNCSGLTSVEIGDNVTSIKGYVFWYCGALTSITCKAINPPSIYEWTFSTTKSISLYVPAESIEAYKSANYWKQFTNIQAINE